MDLSPRARTLLAEVSAPHVKLGDLRKRAKALKTDHALGLELWSTGHTLARQLGVLVMANTGFTQDFVDQLDRDLQDLPTDEQLVLIDWLLANKLLATKTSSRMVESWEHSPSPLQRRCFWYHQARLRWTGQAPPDNSEALLAALEARMADEVPEVQWAMNFTAGQIGTYQPELRARCIALGEVSGVFRDEVVSRGCTPNYLPEFIRIQVSKLPG